MMYRVAYRYTCKLRVHIIFNNMYILCISMHVYIMYTIMYKCYVFVCVYCIRVHVYNL